MKYTVNKTEVSGKGKNKTVSVVTEVTETTWENPVVVRSLQNLIDAAAGVPITMDVEQTDHSIKATLSLTGSDEALLNKIMDLVGTAVKKTLEMKGQITLIMPGAQTLMENARVTYLQQRTNSMSKGQGKAMTPGG